MDLRYEDVVGFTTRGEIYVRSDATLPDAIRHAVELAIADHTEGDRMRRSIVNLNDPALVKARVAAVRGERKRMERDYRNRTATRDQREERASQLLGRDQLPEFVSIRVAWLRKDAGPRPLMLTPVSITRLEKVATDNGSRPRTGAHAGLARLRQQPDVDAHLAHDQGRIPVSRRHVAVRRPQGPGRSRRGGSPTSSPAAPSARQVSANLLHSIACCAAHSSSRVPCRTRCSTSSRTRQRTCPRTTKAERLVVRRVGQDIFRRGLLEYWDGPLRDHRPRRARTTAREPHQALGRLRHGRRAPRRSTTALLLAPHLDAAFDSGFITIAEDGTVLLSEVLPSGARVALGLDGLLKIDRLQRAHERYMQWHRSEIFRMGVENPRRLLGRDSWRSVK